MITVPKSRSTDHDQPESVITIPGILITITRNRDHDPPELPITIPRNPQPCGANQKGFTGLGTLWASSGITKTTSNEKLCPQYLLRTDEMGYQIRPKNLKHATLLPVGQEGEFKIKKNQMFLSFPDGQDRKSREYQVVGMIPNRPAAEGDTASSSSH